METLPIEYRHLYINNLNYGYLYDSSGGPLKELEINERCYYIVYEFNGEQRKLQRTSNGLIPISEFILQHENFLELYKTLDPEEGNPTNVVIQYDSVWNIIDAGNERGSVQIV